MLIPGIKIIAFMMARLQVFRQQTGLSIPPLAKVPGGVILSLFLLAALTANADRATRDRPIVAIPFTVSKHIAVGDCFQGIRLLGALNLLPGTVDGHELGGLSGLAWDEDVELLYAVSDNARLFHLRPVFVGEHLSDVEVVAAYHLRNQAGQPLSHPWTDSEGLFGISSDNGIPGDTRLAVSFEIRPRVAWYTSTGRWLSDESLPAELSDRSAYHNPNKGLESLVQHPKWGLLTGPEWPMGESTVREVPIAALGLQLRWRYPLSPAPNSALVDMEVLLNGDLLTLERAFVSPLAPLIITLRRTPLAHPLAEKLAVGDVATFDSSRGWQLDNFEGLAHHRNQRFFLISDDNRRSVQKTLLLYFALLDDAETCDKSQDG